MNISTKYIYSTWIISLYFFFKECIPKADTTSKIETTPKTNIIY